MFDLNDARTWFLILESLFLVASIGFILLQNRGAGLSGSFGGGDEIYLTRRGIEKSVVTLTIICISLFVVLRVGSFYLPAEESITQSQESTEFDLSSDNTESSQTQEINVEDLNIENLEGQAAQ